MSYYNDVECEYCDSTFREISHMNQHKNAVHPLCEHCNERCVSRAALKKHINQCHYPCKYCSESFSYRKNLARHYAEDHDFQCEYCTESFPFQTSLENHIDEEHDFECDLCTARFFTEEDCREHEEEEHPTCSICNRTFRRPLDLYRHQSSGIHNVADKNCPFCRKEFRLNSQVATHLEMGDCKANRMSRGDVKRFVRQKERNHNLSGALLVPLIGNGRGYTSFNEATEASWNGSGYGCCMCPREFKELKQLNNHLITHESKDYRCFRCKKQFNMLSGLIKHWEQTSCGDKAYSAARRILGSSLLGN
eukprot:TRINITY_DN17844_c0_g1_i1.p1 TRINITY_DN17844_c0_g1~~TRINITY_DN17844_c0_g1_i1.p1  ORF type:complete len:307 (-),score=28.60 TRINITY_DN17844_c0_g1_i1:26-946(-)